MLSFIINAGYEGRDFAEKMHNPHHTYNLLIKEFIQMFFIKSTRGSFFLTHIICNFENDMPINSFAFYICTNSFC